MIHCCNNCDGCRYYTTRGKMMSKLVKYPQLVSMYRYNYCAYVRGTINVLPQRLDSFIALL